MKQDNNGKKRILEAILFVSREPLDAEKAAEILDTDKRKAADLLEELKKEYAESGLAFELKKLAGGYVFLTREEYFPYIEKHLRPKFSSLSKAALETLAIIAYKQPVVRSQIEKIRGVNVDSLIMKLEEKQLIEEKGRLEAPGRPILYGTTVKFLQYFGLEDISELPGKGNLFL